MRLFMSKDSLLSGLPIDCVYLFFLIIQSSRQQDSSFTYLLFIRLVTTIHVFAHDQTYVCSRPDVCMVVTKRMFAAQQTNDRC